MENKNVINYIKENIDKLENAKSDYAFSNIKVREILANIYAMVSLIDKRPKGKWVRDYQYRCSCSICGGAGVDNYKYCKDCGAEMEVE